MLDLGVEVRSSQSGLCLARTFLLGMQAGLGKMLTLIKHTAPGPEHLLKTLQGRHCRFSRCGALGV